MRGIDFINTDSDFHPLTLLELLDINQFTWHMAEEEFTLRHHDDMPYSKNIFTGAEMKETIIDSRFSIVHMNLRAFPKGAEITDFPTYEEFLSSECILVFILYDTWYVNIRCKDEAYNQRVYDFCCNNPMLRDVELITDDNDYRYKMSVY